MDFTKHHNYSNKHLLPQWFAQRDVLSFASTKIVFWDWGCPANPSMRQGLLDKPSSNPACYASTLTRQNPTNNCAKKQLRSRPRNYAHAPASQLHSCPTSQHAQGWACIVKNYTTTLTATLKRLMRIVC